MINVLLDELPEEWEGYPLNTDFRIGIQIVLAQDDKELNDLEKRKVIEQLLFPEGVKIPSNEAMEKCLEWFINGWNNDNLSLKTKGGKKKKKNNNKRWMDFDRDQWRIYSAFLIQYGINLAETDMHWWEFMGLLTNLDECAYTRVIEIRQKKKTKKMSKEEMEAIDEAKRIYGLESEEGDEAYTPEEKKRIDDFMKYRKKYTKKE